jgi:hypothetical protein
MGSIRGKNQRSKISCYCPFKATVPTSDCRLHLASEKYILGLVEYGATSGMSAPQSIEVGCSVVLHEVIPCYCVVLCRVWLLQEAPSFIRVCHAGIRLRRL